MNFDSSRESGGPNHAGLDGFFSNLLRRFVDPLRRGGHDGPREAFQLRFFLSACILGMLVGLLSLASAIASGERVSVILIVVFVVGLSLHLVAARLGAPARLLMWSLLGVVTVFLIVSSVATREIEPSQLFWLILIPLSARAFAAPRVDDDEPPPTTRITLYAALLSVVAAFAIVVLHSVGLTFNQPWQREPAWATATNYPIFLASVWGLLYLYDLSQRVMVEELQRVRRMLSICAWCRKIRSGDDWVSLEEFATEQTRSDLTHGICPSCTQREFSGVRKES